MEEPLNFEFCSDCGEYLLPEQGRVVIRDEGPVVLCSNCANRPDIGTFEKRYRKFVDKIKGRGYDD